MGRSGDGKRNILWGWPKNMGTITYEQDIVCSKTHLDGITHEQTTGKI